MLLAPRPVEVAGGKLPHFMKEMNCPVITYGLNGRQTKAEVAIRRHAWHLRDEGSIPCCARNLAVLRVLLILQAVKQELFLAQRFAST